MTVERHQEQSLFSLWHKMAPAAATAGSVRVRLRRGKGRQICFSAGLDNCWFNLTVLSLFSLLYKFSAEFDILGDRCSCTRFDLCSVKEWGNGMLRYGEATRHKAGWVRAHFPLLLMGTFLWVFVVVVVVFAMCLLCVNNAAWLAPPWKSKWKKDNHKYGEC